MAPRAGVDSNDRARVMFDSLKDKLQDVFSALGKRGAYHTMEMMKKQLQQNMEQLGCASIEDLTKHTFSK